MRDGIIVLILFVIMFLNFFDVLTDISLGVPTWHIFSESLIVFVSAIGALFLIKDMKARTLNIVTLKKELNLSDDKLKLQRL